MKDFISRLSKDEILVCDGAMGTSLQQAGLEAGQAPEEWNILKPDVVRNIHKGFISAGCDIIITNTFGANPIKLKRAGLTEKLEELNNSAVKIAKDAGKGSVYVLGDIGPTGEFLKPLGTYQAQEFYEAFLKQAAILCRSGVDAFIIETMSALDELETAVRACKAAADIPVIASMTFISGEKGFRTMMGVSIEQAVIKMTELKCDVIGANCGCGSRQMAGIMQEFRRVASKDALLIAQPNAGMPKLIRGKTVFDEPAAVFAKAIPELVKSAVNIIGGCCGTTPEHIKEIVKIVKKRDSSLRSE